MYHSQNNLYSSTRADIEASIVALEFKLRERREIDLEIQELLKKQCQDTLRGQQKERERMFWAKIQADSDLKYRSYIESKLAEERSKRKVYGETIWENLEQLRRKQQDINQYYEEEMQQQMRNLRDIHYMRDMNNMSKTVGLKPDYPSDTYNTHYDMGDQELVQRYRDGRRTQQYLSELDRYRAKVFGAEISENRRYFDVSHENTAFQSRQRELEKQLANLTIQQNHQKQILQQKIREQSLIEQEKQQRRINQLQDLLAKQRRSIEDIVYKQKNQNRDSGYYTQNDLKKTIKNQINSPYRNKDQKFKLFERSPYHRLDQIKNVESQRNSPYLPSSTKRQKFEYSDDEAQDPDPTFRNHKFINNNHRRSRSKDDSKRSISNKTKPLPSSTTPHKKQKMPLSMQLKKQLKKLRENKEDKNLSSFLLYGKNIIKNKKTKAENQKAKQKNNQSSLSVKKKRENPNKSRKNSARIILGTTVKNIEETALRKIDNRLRVSECIFQDSKWRNLKHQIQHLHNTYDTQLRLRTQIRDKINQHPDILKKHAMVVS